jgi:hypothetical protein
MDYGGNAIQLPRAYALSCRKNNFTNVKNMKNIRHVCALVVCKILNIKHKYCDMCPKKKDKFSANLFAYLEQWNFDIFTREAWILIFALKFVQTQTMLIKTRTHNFIFFSIFYFLNSIFILFCSYQSKGTIFSYFFPTRATPYHYCEWK